MFSVRATRLEKLRSANYDGTPAEWSDILHHVLIPNIPTGLPESLLDTLEVTCTVSEKNLKPYLSVTIRQSVEGITHKFGSIEFRQDPDVNSIDMFSWVNQTVEGRDKLAAELKSSKSRIEKAEESVKALQKELQELIRVKEEHEMQLLSKFTLLLNEKKLRIRAQQRQIANARFAPGDSVSSNPSNPEKRKDKVSDSTADDNNSSSEGFDAMEVDQDHSMDDKDFRNAETTSTDADTSNSEALSPRNLVFGQHQIDDTTIPPPRELPFDINRSNRMNVDPLREIPETTGPDNEETASEDDEL